MSRQTKSIAFWIVLLLCLFWQLGSRGLNEPDEGRAAAIAREMFASGDWLIPRLFDHAHLNKPPLLYWSLCASYATLGVNEWGARVPAAAAALGTLLLTAALARRMLGRENALLATALLATAPLFFVMARLIDYNMMLTVWVTGAIWAAWAWIEDGRPVYRTLFHIALVLAFLTKGPVGPVIVVAGLLVYRTQRSKGWPWRPLFSPVWAVATLILSLSWHLLLIARDPGLWHFFVGDELVGRVLTEEHHRTEPFFFYVFMIPAAVLPWIGALVGALRNMRSAGRTRPGVGLVWCIVAFAFVLFTLSKSKMPTYILPLLPLIAIAAAGHLAGRSDESRRRALRVAAAIGAIVPGGLVAFMAFKYAWNPWFLVLPLVSSLSCAAFGGWLTSGVRMPVALGVLLSILPPHLAAHAALVRNENRIGPHDSFKSCAVVLNREWRPGDRVALLSRYPRGSAFYFEGPIGVWLEKFPPQLEDDTKRVAGKDFTNPAEIFQAFDATGRVFIIGTEDLLTERKRDAKRAVHVLYNDERHVLLSNEPARTP